MIMQKTTITDKNKNAKTVDEFYYTGMEEQLAGQQGTGVRLLAGDFMRQGKVLDRFLILRDNGCVLEIYMLFNTAADLTEFINHPVTLASKVFFSNKPWTIITEQYPIDDYLSVRGRLNQLPSIASKS
jgi:hypothetical protein